MKRSRIVTEIKPPLENPQEINPGIKLEPAGDVRPDSPREELVAISAEEIKSQNVVNGKGQYLGKIEDLMIDLKTGRIAYAVLSFDGFLGVGNKLFAIPWELLCLENQWNYRDIYRERIIFNVSRDKLEKAPGFDRNRWPREPDRKWLQEVFEYYGCQPYWAPPEEAAKQQPPEG